jgi:UDP-N-acetylmuramoyl-tripeptide--D-alanyl-D-alanine ligase
MAIIEMGANHQKEIEGYCKIAEPTHGLITNIGKAHLEGFGGTEGVKKGKGELYDYLLKSGGKAFVNSTSTVLMEMQKFNEPVLYPQSGDFYHCKLKESTPYIRFIAENGQEIQTHLIGAYNFDNIAAALCIGKFFEVPAEIANHAVASYVPENNRSQIIEKGTNHIILDAYNANPSSMKAAIENFAGVPADKKIAILGDMFELGSESKEEHFQLGTLLKSKSLTKVFLCGKEMAEAKKAYPEALYFENREDLLNFLQKEKIMDSHVLIKGSRGMGLEKVVDVL